MGVPKRRVSHARQGERRAHLAIDLPALEECPHCHEMKLPAPRLPELRLVPGSPGGRAQAGRRPHRRRRPLTR